VASATSSSYSLAAPSSSRTVPPSPPSASSRLSASSEVAFGVEDEGIVDLLDASIPYF